MSATLRIQDGNPIWLSSSIVPSKDTVVSPNSSPTLAAIQVTSTDVFVYVKVENSGTVDLGACSCATGPWVVPTFFQGFSTDPNATTTQTVAGVTFTLNKFGDTLSG